jgi:hypothetical protein
MRFKLSDIQVNCSEAVFRFWTVEPVNMQKILQAVSNEISKNSGFKPHKKQKIPLLKTAEEYDTHWTGHLTYSPGDNKELIAKKAERDAVWKKRDTRELTQEAAAELAGKIEDEIGKIVYPNSMLRACAGLGDNEAVISVNKEKGYFDLNIGNNDISADTTNWTELVQSICKCEEAEGHTESSKELVDKARDCTCGLTFFK